MKVAFVNNYSMEDMYKMCTGKKFPSHHLWGADLLKDFGIEVEVLSFSRYSFLKKQVSHRGMFGDLDQQLQLLLRRDYEAIYSGAQDVTNILAYLRAFGLFKKPIVSIIHHPLYMVSKPKRSLNIVKHLRRFYVRGTDRLVCLNQHTKAFLRCNLGVSDAQSPVIHWGPDLSFYNVSNQFDSVIVSVGKTFRDYDTFCKALRDTKIETRIFSAGTYLPRRPIPTHVHFEKQYVRYDELLYWYKKALFIAIPLIETTTLVGLTILLDAMAVGKPVVMTGNPCIDIDIEKEGIGIWVEPGDVMGWRKAIKYFVDNPNQAKAMGQKGRDLCERAYNIKLFSERLSHIIKETVHSCS